MAVRLVRFLRSLTAPQGADHVPDAQLLARFAASRDEAAFAALVRRHGPMVLNVCRRILSNADDADDCLQAAFLVLARKADAIRRQTSVAAWLHGVARRVALKARATAARRRAVEREATSVRTAEPDPAEQSLWRDLRPLLDDEVAGLPAKERAVVVLCYLEGRRTEEAAALLGCPRGTVLSRLARARQRLRARLTRRGVGLSAGALAAGLSRGAEAALSPALVRSTVQAAARFAAGNPAVAVASARVAALTEGVLRAMRMTRLRFVASVLLAASLLAVGSGLLPASQKTADETKAAKPAADPGEEKVIPMKAADVATAFLGNDALADEAYINKKVRVHGKLLQIRRARWAEAPGKDKIVYWLVMQSGYLRMAGKQGQRVVFVGPARLDPGEDSAVKYPLAFLFLDPQARSRLAKLTPGDDILVEGRCEGLGTPLGQMEMITFRDSRLVEMESTTAAKETTKEKK